MEYKKRLENKKEELTSCLSCGKTVYGRIDKKFCSPKCKNKFHNLEESDCRKIKNRIFSGLNKNYQILDKLVKLKMKSIAICDIETLGYKTGIVTGFSKTKAGHNEFRCFDIKYEQTMSHLSGIERITNATLQAYRSPQE